MAQAHASLPDEAAVWRWLSDVPDPEIPVVSVVDLGIVRDVARVADTLVVTITPTYSGCPATAAIARAIETALRVRGAGDFRVETQLAPAWTTDWITAAGREKLRAFGIAPPLAGAGATCSGLLARTASVACPRCGSARTEQISRFGSTPCKAAWRCTECREPFDYFKPY